jgi:hypothetical protein
MTTRRTLEPLSRRTALAGLGAGGLGIALAATARPAAAQDAAAMANHPIVGAWLVLSSPPGPMTIVFHPDGTCVFGVLTTVPGPNGVGFSTAGLGMWEPTGERTMRFTATQFFTDATGAVTGSASSAVSQTVSEDGQTFVGPQATAVITIRDAAHNVIQTIENAPIPDVQGIRMRYAAPGFPEMAPDGATPTA